MLQSIRLQRVRHNLPMNNKLNKSTITITGYYYYFLMLKIFCLLDWTNPDKKKRRSYNYSQYLIQRQ